MIIMPMPASRGPIPVVTLETPPDSYSIMYPVGEALVSVDMTVDAAYIQRSTGGAWTEQAMAWDAIRSKWYRADCGAGLTQDTVSFRARVVLGGVSYYSDVATGTVLYPAVQVSAPTDSFTLNAGATSTAIIYVETGLAITYAGIEIYEDSAYVETTELSYDSTADGKDYYSGTITHPGLPGGAPGSVVGKMTISGVDRFSNEITGTWVVV